jgi:hypothetical protein
MNLTNEQKNALYQIVNGIREKNLKEQSLGGFAGTGKAQPLHSLIATPNGFVSMGEIQIGDEVCTPNGRTAKVSGVFPQGQKAIYRVWFSDGHYVECCDNHLWKVIDRRRLSNLKKYKTPYKTFPLSYIRDFINRKDGRNRFYIETSSPANFASQEVPLDPYLLGVLLGDGSMTDNNFSVHNEDDEILDSCRQECKKWNCHLDHQGGVTYHIVGEGRGKSSTSVKIRNVFRDLNLWNCTCETKFIPHVYLQNSVEIRLAVLQGLMDTDGEVDKRSGMVALTTTSFRLAADVCFLVESLGGLCRISTKTPTCRYKGKVVVGKEAWVLNIGFNNTSQVFRLNRKKFLAKSRTKYQTRRCIRDIEYVGDEEAQCIMINDPNHLYLTDHFIPTHNTTLIKYLTQFFPSYGICAYTGKAANVLRSKKVDGASTIHSRIYQPFFDNGVVYFDLAVDPGCNGFIIDEASMVSEEIYCDLRSFGLPMVFVGDHGQLEPIGDGFNLMQKPDYKLEKIHRNAGDIAHFAGHVRRGIAARGFKPSDGSVTFASKVGVNDFLEVDQVICAYNKTRVGINAQVREALGHKGLLNVGERVMCLKNNRRQGLFNGMQGTVVKLYQKSRGGKYMDFLFGDTMIEGVKYSTKHFGKESYDIGWGGDGPHPFDYAYCITCHKAQGDEFDHVLVIEQKCRKWDHKRWAYTAASRPKVSLKWKLAA